jgi:hypothetical protein
MANKVITIETIVDGKKAPVTGGNFAVRVSPYTSDSVVGNHLADGNWEFQNVPYADIELWNVDTGTKISTYSRQTTPSMTASLQGLTVNGNVTLDNGIINIGDQVFFTGDFVPTLSNNTTTNETASGALVKYSRLVSHVNSALSSVTGSLGAYALTAGNNVFIGSNQFLDNVVQFTNAGVEFNGNSTIVGFENLNRMYFSTSNSAFLNYSRSPLCVEEIDARYASFTGTNTFTGQQIFNASNVPQMGTGTGNMNASGAVLKRQWIEEMDEGVYQKTLSSNNLFTGSTTATNYWLFKNRPVANTSTPISDVDTLITYRDAQNLLAITGVLNSYSHTIVKLDPNGEDTPLYNVCTSWTGATERISALQEEIAITPVTLQIAGAAVTEDSISILNNGSEFLPDYTTVVGQQEGIKLVLPNNTIQPSEGKSSFRNVTLVVGGDDHTPILRYLNNLTNVTIDFSSVTGAYITLRDCSFNEGVKFKLGSNSAELISCSGSDLIVESGNIIDSGGNFITNIYQPSTLKFGAFGSTGYNFEFSSVSGTKFGTSSAQKIGFYNTTPVTQPSLTGLTVNNITAFYTGHGSYNNTEDWDPGDITSAAQNVYNNQAMLVNKINRIEQVLKRLGLWTD